MLALGTIWLTCQWSIQSVLLLLAHLLLNRSTTFCESVKAIFLHVYLTWRIVIVQMCRNYLAFNNHSRIKYVLSFKWVFPTLSIWIYAIKLPLEVIFLKMMCFYKYCWLIYRYVLKQLIVIIYFIYIVLLINTWKKYIYTKRVFVQFKIWSIISICTWTWRQIGTRKWNWQGHVLS